MADPVRHSGASWLLPEPKPGTPDAWRLWQAQCDFVHIHDSYESYYARLADLFQQAVAGDEIFLVGWEFMLRETFLVPGKTAETILKSAALDRGVRIRLLTPGGRPVQVKGIDAAEDYQYINIHHQKAVYAEIKGVSHLFVGGMDIALGFGKEPRLGYWFDAQAEIRGPAALLGKLTLEERWASVHGVPSHPFFAQQWRKSPTFCQFVRSYSEEVPPKDRNGRVRSYPFDLSYGNLLRHVVDRSTKLIYVEDQFFVRSTVPPGLDQLLRNAVARGVTLVVVTARGNQIQMDHSSLVRYLSAAIPQKDRLHFFQLKENPPPKPYFVHTKTWIVDDEVVIVGSANYWDRSMMGSDTEFGVAIASLLSEDGLTFAHALRVRLWNRLLKAIPGAGKVSAKPDMVDELPALTTALERLP